MLQMNSGFMQKIVELAKSVEVDIPVAALLAKDDEIIAVATNQKEQKNNATYHAEMLVIDEASKKLGRWRLNDCDLYVTLEPCPMCAGAILNSRVDRVVYGSPDTRFGGCGTTIDVITGNALKRAVQVTGGVLAEECLGTLKAFFQQMRLEKGDTGAKPQ